MHSHTSFLFSHLSKPLFYKNTILLEYCVWSYTPKGMKLDYPCHRIVCLLLEQRQFT